MLLLMKVSLLMSWRISGKFPDSRLYGHATGSVNATALPRELFASTFQMSAIAPLAGEQSSQSTGPFQVLFRLAQLR